MKRMTLYQYIFAIRSDDDVLQRVKPFPRRRDAVDADKRQWECGEQSAGEQPAGEAARVGLGLGLGPWSSDIDGDTWSTQRRPLSIDRFFSIGPPQLQQWITCSFTFPFAAAA